MAKKETALPGQKVEKYDTPSQYGSHASMIQHTNADGMPVLRDEHGLYWTYPDRIENRLADPCRYSATHRIVSKPEELHAITDMFGPGAVIQENPARHLQNAAVDDTTIAVRE